MKGLGTFIRVLRLAPPHRVVALGLLMLVLSATEGIGLMLLVPLLEFVAGGLGQNPIAAAIIRVLSFFGLPSDIRGLLSFFILLIVFRAGLQFLRERVSVVLRQELVDALRTNCLSNLLHAEWSWLAKQTRSDHVNLVMHEVSRIGAGLQSGIGLSATGTAVAAYLVTAFVISPEMTVLVAASGGMIYLLMTRLRRHAHALGQEQGQVNRAMMATVQESLSAIRLSKLLGNESRHLQFLTDSLANVRRNSIAFALNISTARMMQQVLGAVMLAFYIFAGLEWLKVGLPELLTLVLIFSRLTPQFMALQNQQNQLLHMASAAAEIFDFLDESAKMAEPPSPAQAEQWPVKNAIELRGVYLHYEGRARPALDGIELTLPACATTAVIGHSGAGKSTLADVLTGLLMPDQGQLLVDGTAVEGTERKRWMRAVSYVPQDVFLFHDTIRANLLWGYPEASEQTLETALRRAAAEFVFDLPLGLETVVGDAGLRLSGGERQRIALARALLQRPSLLILDEATSALDRENETRIRAAIEALHGDLTVLLIGHRHATLQHADNVVVMETGRILRQGGWDEIGVSDID